MPPRAITKVMCVVSVGVLIGATTACSRSEVGEVEPVKIGWEVPHSGAMKPIGDELSRGFQLYLDTHDNQLGGRNVDLVTPDETTVPEGALDAAKKLISDDHVVAMAGLVGSSTLQSVLPYAQQKKVPIVSPGKRPKLGPDELDGLWHTSQLAGQQGEVLARYVGDHVDEPVYTIGPDTAASEQKLASLDDQAAGEIRTEFPDSDDFGSYLAEIAASDAHAIVASYEGQSAVDFVKQYAKSDAASIPLYGPDLTHEQYLAEQGNAAKDVYSTDSYSSDLDNSANSEFISQWLAAESPGNPSSYAVNAWDCAQVLDQAIAKIPRQNNVTSGAIDHAIGELGSIQSPRGDWKFDPKTHTPIQRWYLRQVRKDGDNLANVRLEELATM